MKQAHRIENTWLWEAYCNKKMELAAIIQRHGIRVDPVVGLSLAELSRSAGQSLNEVYLLHGCHAASAQTIIQSGFDECAASVLPARLGSMESRLANQP